MNTYGFLCPNMRVNHIEVITLKVGLHWFYTRTANYIGSKLHDWDCQLLEFWHGLKQPRCYFISSVFRQRLFFFSIQKRLCFINEPRYSVRIYFATGTQMRKLILSDLCIYGIKHLYKLCSFCKWWLLSASEKLTHVQIAPAIFNRYSSPLKVSNSLFGCPLKTAQYCP